MFNFQKLLFNITNLSTVLLIYDKFVLIARVNLRIKLINKNSSKSILPTKSEEVPIV